MCPACILTIGGGLFLAKRLGINNIFAIGLMTVLLSLFLDITLRKINNGKVFFAYQKIIISSLLFIIILIIKIIIN